MSASHEVMFYSDGRHSSVYLYEPPMAAQQYVEPIDELVDLGIDTISYAVGDCSVLLYATKTGERWGHNVDLTDHDIWWRAAHNARLMIESGTDPLMLVCEHAQRRGFKFLPSLLLNMLHTPPSRVTNCRVADFTTEHPEWQVGEEPDEPLAQYDRPNRLSFAIDEVRADRLAVIKELVADYPGDGIELNMCDYAPFIGRGEVAEHTATMTLWMRQIRAVCDEAARGQGRDKRLVVRVGAALAGNLAMGIDVETWIREGIVDAVLCMQVVGGYESDTSGLREIVAAAAGIDVRVLAGIESSNQEELTSTVVRAAAGNAYAAGAEGTFFHTYYPHPKRYPYDHEAVGRLRFMGHPDLVARMDKTYRIGLPANAKTALSYGLQEPLPAELDESERVLKLEVGDDIAGRAAAGELWRCELRVLVQHLTHTDRVALRWNDEALPETEWRKADWTYQLRPRPDFAVNAYRLHLDLKSRLPRTGVNEIGIKVVEKDAQLIYPITVAEVALVIEYLPHRNALRDEEEYSS